MFFPIASGPAKHSLFRAQVSIRSVNMDFATDGFFDLFEFECHLPPYSATAETAVI